MLLLTMASLHPLQPSKLAYRAASSCISELTWTSFPLWLTSARSANDIDDAQDADAGLLDRLEDVLLEMQDDSVDDSRSNTTGNAVGAAAADNDVIMGGLDAVAVAADHGNTEAVSDESGEHSDISIWLQ